MSRNVEIDPGFKVFEASCVNIPPAQIRKDWRIQLANMAFSRRVWDGSRNRSNTTRSFIPRPSRP